METQGEILISPKILKAKPKSSLEEIADTSDNNVASDNESAQKRLEVTNCAGNQS